MQDKYYVYRPILNLLGFTEGTDKKRGYNETLAYGAYTNGDVELVKMTLDQIDKLQTSMLAHPDNKWNSSALGRYQIVRTTLREIRKQLLLTGSMLFDRDMQDRMACYLLGVRGVDKYLSGRMKEDTFINQLSMEWASMPTTEGKGYYGGQNAAVSVARVRAILAEVRKRHTEGQPKEIVEVPVPVEKPIVPESIEKEVKKKFNLFSWITGIFGGAGGLSLGALAGLDTTKLLIILGSTLFVVVVMLVAGEWIVRRIRTIKDEIESET